MKNHVKPFLILVSSLILFFGVSSLWSESGVVAYLEGDVSIEKPGSSRRIAAIGDAVGNGDTLYTASESFVEITMESGSTVSIDSDSVFNFGEIADSEAPSRKRGFFRVLLGSVSFKLRNLAHEPDVGTPLSVCAVRGTDFTVYTAADGTSMTVVSDGLVEVSAGGQSTLLAADQGVEVAAGLGLGETFDAKYGFVRYDAFAKQALSRLEEHPSLVIEDYTKQLEKYIEDGKFYLEAHEFNMAELIKVRSKVPEIREKEGDDAAERYLKEELGPLQERGFNLNATYRYHFISALFLRRYVISSIYIQMRTLYLDDTDNADWLAFSRAFNEFLELYEEGLIPFLEVEDL